MDIKNRSKIMYGLFGILMLATLAFAFSPSLLYVSTDTTTSGLDYKGVVCTTVDRADGTHEDLGCSSNALTDAGAEAIIDFIVDGKNNNFSYIALCNATSTGTGCGVAAVGDTTVQNEFAGCGLTRAAGTTGDPAGEGNVTIYTTFTSSCAGVETNRTGLFNASAADTMLAVNTFTLVSLESSDQLTVNWSIQVT